MSTKRYCDGCDTEIQRDFTKGVELHYQFPSGLKVAAKCTFGSSVNHQTGGIIWNDGNLCEACAATVIREGKEIE